MILEHEIPQGSKLHFGASAKIKREVEHAACEVFYENDFEEILTPCFVYLEHQKNFSNRNIIRLSSQNNHQISLRYDSTIDAIRIITKRLGRSTNQKKWFYIQPVYSYPSNEIHQIGAECLNADEMSETLRLGASIINRLGISPVLQISNVKILKLCAQDMGMEVSKFQKMHIDDILSIGGYLEALLRIQTKEDLENFIKISPNFLKAELEVLLKSGDDCDYPRVIFSPLDFAPIEYYNDLVFRMFEGNHTLLLGGKYRIEDTESCGFGIYTDDVVDCLMRKDLRKNNG
ncbi:ATP phosphoribosyltransferase regulatory subunit [Helicobacter cappadocius]|uniref:ATP phosphoribosyltransferase regulatory subunit n=1 Tax=Helicobacter cappadocius TaxID=3063998 RepID=A0AA90TEE8_9HELI|nr:MULTISPECIES: ATP phosphoribosyltransferase regulatory subunit [unclassified Helicobacter]MDO7252653.1 ATP phosphoribosyltransferase regulatory subunit [Helicobacter sp. faydin-H75]MDP2538520.1 ATP phosphoribosyltransferase regulatory subunit [Helicobacter sp. faydin-H76]